LLIRNRAILALRCFWTASRSYEQSSSLRHLNL
jgi:peptide methionine sulfoxide reductase MsrA